MPYTIAQPVLRRALDGLYDYGVTKLFRDLSAHAAEKLGLTSRSAHLDATSFSFHGDYDSDEEAAAYRVPKAQRIGWTASRRQKSAIFV
jgi:hypothetical protein